MPACPIIHLPKPFRAQDLLDAIAQGVELSRAWRSEAASIADLQACHASLTPRERQVMAPVVTGRLNKQIAGDLDVSEVTVKAHRGQVMRKMRATSVAELVRFADRLKIPAAGVSPKA